MRLLEVTDLQAELEKHLAAAEQFDFAVAWARSSDALLAIQDAAARGVKVRAIVGLAGNFTEPMVLRTLHALGALRIAEGNGSSGAPRGIFHPKVFLFRRPSGASFGWIGSANLTDGGFARNLEAVWETPEPQAVKDWFDHLWNTLEPNCTEQLDRYEEQWRQPDHLSHQLASSGSKAPMRPILEYGIPRDWPAYLHALEATDAYWIRRAPNYDFDFSVLGESYSWLETIQVVGSLIHRSTWSNLTDLERWIILGIVETTGAWGLLGSMKGAGRAKEIFGAKTDENRLILERLRRALLPLIAARGVKDSIEAAIVCLELMRRENGVSHGVATRLMACARPDIAISVNGGSAPALGTLTGLPRTPSSLATPKNYRKLLNWVADQPWYASPRPSDPWEAKVWDVRAALIDCFVYEPVGNSN